MTTELNRKARQPEAPLHGPQRRAEVLPQRESATALDELSLDLSDLGESHTVESRPTAQVLAPALPLAFEPDDLGESPAPRQVSVSMPTGTGDDARGSAPRALPSASSSKIPKPEPSKTHFSSTIGGPRLELDSSEEFDSTPPEELPQEERRSPLSLPKFDAKKTLRATLVHLKKLPALLEASLAASRAKRLLSKTERTRPNLGPQAAERHSLGEANSLRRFKGPLTGVVVVATVYGVSAHLLGSAPWQDRSPGVPDLGATNSPAMATALPPQRDFRIEGEGKPGESLKKPLQNDDSSPGPSAPPLFQVESFPSDANYPGKSLLEVVTSDEELIYVDGVFIGRGPLRRIPLSQGQHAVAIRSGGTERGGQFDAPLGRMVRASFVSIPEETRSE